MVVAPTAVTSLNFNTPVFNKEKVSLASHDEVCSSLYNFSVVAVYSRRVVQPHSCTLLQPRIALEHFSKINEISEEKIDAPFFLYIFPFT
jgi:hypothetical protein